MARQQSPIEVNNWVKGLITEASPLTYPENSSIDEVNFILNSDGSRNRRLGMDFEAGSAPTATTISDVELAISVYNWTNVGGDAEKEFLVVQIGNELTILEIRETLSYNVVHTKKFTNLGIKNKWSFSSVDGLLVVSTGDPLIRVLQFNSYSDIKWSESRLLIRDTFGVEDAWNNLDLKSGQYIDTRPTELSPEHTYNLRNQTWGIPRLEKKGVNTPADPIKSFLTAYGVINNNAVAFPSNADQVTSNLYADTDNSANRTVDRFHPEDLIHNPVGTFAAPSGHFIIDALDRGASRLAAIANMKANYPALAADYNIAKLPADKTEGGSTVVGEYAGRVWFSGFSGITTGGDTKSPKMSSYVLFSRVVKDPSDITQCYQVGDPTSKENPDILDTDGGFVRIDGAFGIKRLVNVGKGLMVVAENGVWYITGDSGFKATNYKVDKITDHGIFGMESLVVVDNTFIYWGNDGIYHVKSNQFGEWSAQNVTTGTIQRLYDNISEKSKRYAIGTYDAYERKIRWCYDNWLTDFDVPVKELILDASLGAFYKNVISNPTTSMARVIGPVTTLPYSDIHLHKREVKYLTITQTNPTISFAFSTYNEKGFMDWKSTGDGVDAEAFLLTGYISGGDFQRKKGLPNLMFHLRATETGKFRGDDGLDHLINPSSCKVRVQWDWTDNIIAGKWSREFQAYRKQRLYFYDDSGGLPDNDGLSVITSKTTLRGSGRVFAMYIKTEPGFDCNILGWSMVLGMNTNV